MAAAISDEEVDLEDSVPLLLDKEAKHDAGDTSLPNTTIRNRLQNLLLLLLALVVLLATLSIPLRFSYVYNSALGPEFRNALEPTDEHDVCHTPECSLFASIMKQNLAPNWADLDPCTDFRSFACGGWDLQHELRENQVDLQTTTLMAEKVHLMLRGSIEALQTQSYQHGADLGVFEQLVNAYNACMSEDQIERHGIQPILDILAKSAREFYVHARTTSLFNANLNPDQLTKVMTYLFRIDVSAFFTISLKVDDRDSNTTSIYIDPLRRIGLPAPYYYSNEEVVSNYTAAIRDVFTHLVNASNFDSPLANLSSLEIAGRIVEFEEKLAALTGSLSNEPYHTLTPEQANFEISFLSLTDLIAGLQLSQKASHVVTNAESYFRQLSTLLNQTDQDVLLHYLMWKVVQKHYDFIEHEAIKPLQHFNRWLDGQDPYRQKARWRDCVRHVDDNLGWLTSLLYIQELDLGDHISFADTVTSNVKDALSRKLKAASWMQPQTRDLALQKLNHLFANVAYPRSPTIDLRRVESVEQYYHDLVVVDDDYFANALAMARHRVEKAWSHVDVTTQKDDWTRPITSPNAQYRFAFNDIILPAALLQSPAFFGRQVPAYLTYGGFGSIVGHELSHAFDDNGRHYDASGSRKQWWDETTIAAFENKTTCFVHQYNQYTIMGPNEHRLHVNGKLTLNENVADTGGVNAAFEAWKKTTRMTTLSATNKNSVPPAQSSSSSSSLPGLSEFTEEQLFFLAYGGMWCAKTRPSNLADRVHTDPHAPSFARLLGSLENSVDFQEAFRCPAKKPKCALW